MEIFRVSLIYKKGVAFMLKLSTSCRYCEKTIAVNIKAGCSTLAECKKCQTSYKITRIGDRLIVRTIV